MAANRECWSIAHPGDGEQPASVGQLEVQRWSTWIELALGEPVAPTDLPESVNQLVVVVSDCGSGSLTSIGVLDEDGVAPVRDDVLDLLIIEEWLQPPELEEAVEHCAYEALFRGIVEYRTPFDHRFPREHVELSVEQLPSESHLVVALQPTRSGSLCCSRAACQLGSDGRSQFANDPFVDVQRCHATGASARGIDR
jgi:hypothetical protein